MATIYTVNVQGGGRSIQASVTRSGDSSPNAAISLPAGKAVTAWVKTDANTAACNLPGGHGQTDGKFDVYWSGGYRYGVDGTIATNALSLDGGSGTDFPASATTGVVVCKQVPFNIQIDGDNAKLVSVLYAVGATTGYGCRVTWFDAVNGGGSAVGSGYLLAPDAPNVCDITGGATNLYSGNVIASGIASNGDSANDAILTVIAEVDSTPT